MIEDNFLKQETFDKLQLLMVNPQVDKAYFPWYFRCGYYDLNESEKDYNENAKRVTKAMKELNNFQFTHPFYCDNAPQSPFLEQLNPILEKLQPISLWRVVANLLPRLPTPVENPLHTDMSFLSEQKQKQWMTAIFYMNTNDGYTIFEDGTKVESVANRMITFPANMKHTGTSCTNQQTRVLINFAYMKLK